MLRSALTANTESFREIAARPGPASAKLRTYRWYDPDYELTAHEIADGLADLLLNGLGALGAAELVAEGQLRDLS
jgi:hypothetical protein